MYQDLPPPFESIVRAHDDATVLSQPFGGSSTPSLVTMSWTGQSFGATGGALGEGERPPEYVRELIGPVVYSFTPNSSDSMLLFPPRDAPDTRPLYHISVALNIFNPSSGVTIIRRGGRADGEFVCELEWGHFRRSAPTITMGNMQLAANDVMKLRRCKDQNWFEYMWKWDEDRARMLYWTFNLDDHVTRCYWVPDNADPSRWAPNLRTESPIAVFTGRPFKPRADKRLHPLITLKVFLPAHERTRLDYIVLGALLLERTKLAL